MPPGSKKRKAAKKKKQKEPISSPHHSQFHSHDLDGKELSDGGEISSPMSEEGKEELEKKNSKQEDSPSEKKEELLVLNQEDPVVEVLINESSLQQSETSKSSSSCRSSSSSTSNSSDDDQSHHSHAVEKNILMIESITGGYKEDDHYDPKPSDLDLSVKDDSEFLEEIKVEAALDPVGVPPFQDHDLLESTDLEKNSVHQTDLNLPKDLSAVSSVNSIPLTDDDVVEQNDIIPEAIQVVDQEENGIIVPEAIQVVDQEENGIIVPEAIQEVEETVTITESQVKADKLVSEAIVTGFPKDSSSVVSDNDRKKTTWISCCGLFELFSGSNR